MIDHAALARVESAVSQARDASALITTGGQPDGPCYRPTVIEQAASTNDIAPPAQQAAGPIAPCQKPGRSKYQLPSRRQASLATKRESKLTGAVSVSAMAALAQVDGSM